MKHFKIGKMLLVVLLFFGAVGCKKEGNGDVLFFQETWINYKTANEILVYAPDAEGNLYTLEREAVVAGEFKQDVKSWFCRYDREGNLIFSKDISYDTVKSARSMTYRSKKLYFAAQKIEGGEVFLVLYAADADTGKIEDVDRLSGLDRILRVTVVGDCFYFLGGTESSEEKVYAYSLSAGTMTDLGLDGVIDIAAMQDGNLLIYKQEGEGYEFLAYSPSKTAVRTLAKTEKKITERIADGQLPGSLVFMGTESDKSVKYAFFSDIDNMAEVYPAAKRGNYCLVCVDGKVFVEAEADRTIAKVDLTGIEPKERALRCLSGKEIKGNPYGCGFTITREELESDKLVLKLLAKDKDFDMTYVNSWFSSLTGIRDSGCFYPLNDVPGVQEYLDCCFPYVREAATDADGNIWMLPVCVDLQAYIYNTKADTKHGTVFQSDMTYEEFLAAMESLTEQERKLTQGMVVAREFMTSYLYHHKSIDTPEFRNGIEAIRKILSLFGNGAGAENFILCATSWQDSSSATFLEKNFGTDGRLISYPKEKKNDLNVATCRGIVINPKSEQLEEVLRYVAAVAAYQMNREEVPSFFAVPENVTDSMAGSLYRLYQNSTITMGIEEAVYAGYYDVVSGARDIEDYIRETEPKLKIYFGE